MRVRRNIQTGVAPERRCHACTVACFNTGSTLRKVFMRVRRHAPTGVASQRRDSCVDEGVLQLG